MTDDNKALMECELCAKLTPDMEQSAARTASQIGCVMQCRECGRVYKTSAAIIRNLIAENERLREALRNIAARKTGSPHQSGQIKNEHRAMIAEARAALGDTK